MNQQPQSVQSHPVERGDELDLPELWRILLEYKLAVIFFTIMTTLGSIYYVGTLPTTYKAEVLMIPSSNISINSSVSSSLASVVGFDLGGSVTNVGPEAEEALARLRTRVFLNKFIKEKKLKEILFADSWDKKEKQWIDKEPTDRFASKLLGGMINGGPIPKNRAGLVSIVLEWENPVNPERIADIANSLIKQVNFQAKERTVVEAKKNILFLEKELKKTDFVASQSILYSMIESQIQKIMLANVRDEFVFKVIDPAIIPKYPENKPVFLIIFIGVILGVMLGIFYSINMNYFKKH
jgi:uncharacterized protein involved in exopolysaccharide biosynthesis